MLGRALGATRHHSSKQVSAVCQSTALHFIRSTNWTLAGDGSLLILLSTPILISSKHSPHIALVISWNLFFRCTGQYDTLGLNRKASTQNNVLLVKNFAAKYLDEAHESKHVCTSSAPHQRENTSVVGCANANPCALGPGSIGSEQQFLVLASEDWSFCLGDSRTLKNYCTLFPNGFLDRKCAHHVMKPANISTSVPLTGCYREDVLLPWDQADGESVDTQGWAVPLKGGDSTWIWFTLGKVLSNKVWDRNRAAFWWRGGNPLGRSVDTCNWNKLSYKLVRLIWKPQHLKHRHRSALFWVLLQALLPQLLTPQACVTQPYNQNTCVLCYSILSRRDSREKHRLQGDWGASLVFLLVPTGNTRELPTEQGHRPHRGYSEGHVQKNHRRNPIFPAPYYPENTQSSRFEGANPPTAVFLVMTHKIPHNSDTIFLIKPATKMKLYIWCLKKKKGRKKKDKTLLVAKRWNMKPTVSVQWKNKADGCALALCRQGFERWALQPATKNLLSCMLRLTQMFA